MVTKCKEGKEKNKNGRCVKKCRDLFERNSAGKGKKVKTPPPGYMLNLLTNRFVKIDGPTGKYLLGRGDPPAGFKKSKDPAVNHRQRVLLLRMRKHLMSPSQIEREYQRKY